MLTWSCARVRADLSAYHDDELAVEARIAIADHLDACPACCVESSDLAAISDALRAAARVEDVAVMPAMSRIQTDVLERWQAEERASLKRAIRNVLDDPQRVSASVGVSVVASLCLAFGAFLVAQSPIRHPESLKAALTLKVRGRTADIYLPSVELPRAYAEAVMPAAVLNRDDEEIAFAALVTADGHLADLELLGERTRSPRAQPATHAELSALLNAAATARFEPARVAGAPVSQNVVWVVSSTTVRAPLRAYVHVRVNGWKML